MENDDKNKTDRLEFRSVARSYIYEYAKPLDPENLTERKFGALGFGHAANIVAAVAQRKKYIRRLQAAAGGLSETDLRAVQQGLLETFKFDRQTKQHCLIKDYYDRADVAEVLEEAVQIALGNTVRVKSVYNRFEERKPAPLSPNRANYDAMMRGSHFDI